jgi:hypothetical protein
MTYSIEAILIGTLFILIGYGQWPVSQEFLKKWGKFYRIAGPFLLLCGIAIFVFRTYKH